MAVICLLHFVFMTENMIYKDHGYNGLVADENSYMVNFLHPSILDGRDNCAHTKGL